MDLRYSSDATPTHDAAVKPGGEGMPPSLFNCTGIDMIEGIAGRIGSERMALAMTQSELAKLIGTYQPVVSMWESGNQ